MVITVLKEQLVDKVMFDFGEEEFLKLGQDDKQEKDKKAIKIDKILKKHSKKLIISANLTRPMMSLNKSKEKIEN